MWGDHAAPPRTPRPGGQSASRHARHARLAHPRRARAERALRRAAPDTRLVLQMHCEWLVDLPGPVVREHLAPVDLVLGVSTHIVDQIASTFPAIADRCRVLHNGVDPAAFPSRARIESERAT